MTEVLAWTGVALCGAAGSYGRFWVGRALTAARPSDFPYGTFAVNLSGGFLLGLLTGLTVTGDAHLTLGTGLLGAYTTFSTWMFEAQRLAEDGAACLAEPFRADGGRSRGHRAGLDRGRDAEVTEALKLWATSAIPSSRAPT